MTDKHILEWAKVYDIKYSPEVGVPTGEMMVDHWRNCTYNTARNWEYAWECKRLDQTVDYKDCKNCPSRTPGRAEYFLRPYIESLILGGIKHRQESEDGELLDYVNGAEFLDALRALRLHNDKHKTLSLKQVLHSFVQGD